MSHEDALLPAIPDACCLDRRSLLRAAGVAVVALPTFGLLAPAAAAAEPTPSSHKQPSHRPREARTRVVLLGTAGGPVLNSRGRKGISTAVVYDGRVYIVDLGHGSPDQINAAGLGPNENGTQSALINVRGIFFTHMHSDHITEWPAVYMTGPTNTNNGRIPQPIHVFGPGNRGTLPAVSPPGRPQPAVVNPSDPTPGMAGMTSHLRQAFANDFNDRIRATGLADPDSVFAIKDIDISKYWTVDPAGVPPVLPKGTRIPVWIDGDVTITATLVNHNPSAPAFAFRFDTPDGSVVVSGDTAPSANLIDLAHGVDYLVHEAIDEVWVEEFLATVPAALRDQLRHGLLDRHTTLGQVGKVADQADAKNLVLTHLIPPEIPRQRFNKTHQDFSGRLIVGEDLMDLPVRCKDTHR